LSQIRERIANEGSTRASERRSFGLIGHVIEYFPEAAQVPDEQRHTCDVRVIKGKNEQVLYKVPCFVYSQGIISDGLAKNDRVWVEFINGDSSLPVITGFYREPGALKFFWNSFKYGVANVFDELGFGE
jgi:hypothetical protein